MANEITHLCPECGTRNTGAGECGWCFQPLVAPEPGLVYEFEGEDVEIVDVEGVVLTDSDGHEYTIEELADAIEQGDAKNVRV